MHVIPSRCHVRRQILSSRSNCFSESQLMVLATSRMLSCFPHLLLPNSQGVFIFLNYYRTHFLSCLWKITSRLLFYSVITFPIKSASASDLSSIFLNHISRSHALHVSAAHLMEATWERSEGEILCIFFFRYSWCDLASTHLGKPLDHGSLH